MISITMVLFSATWVGTAQVDMMAWEGGGEHPYRTRFDLTYREAAETPIRDSAGKVVGRRIRLIPDRVALEVHHEVRGLLNCSGSGEETVVPAPEGQLVVPLPGGNALGQIVGLAVLPAGAYQLVLPRASGAYACGNNNRNRNDRRAAIGTGLFAADLDVPDTEPRFLERDGSLMKGAYVYRRERSADGTLQHVVKKEFRVQWELRRREGP